MGMIPERLTSPRVGLMPTMPLVCAGQMIEPSVSVPIAAAQKLDATAAPEPELDPQAERSSAYGLRVSPPRDDQPLEECVERKLAHSLRLVLPKMIAPASRSLSTKNASRGAIFPSSASDPAVVCILSAVSMFSLIRMGIPCNEPRTCPVARSSSSLAAISSALGLISRMEQSCGSKD